MNTPTVRAIALTVITLTLSAYSSPAYAQHSQGQSAQGQGMQTDTATPAGQFSAKTGALVLEARTLMTGGQNEEALIKLGEALSRPSHNTYETSIIHQLQGAAHYEQDRYAASITAFENAINAGGLSPNEVNQMDLIIAQLMIANGQSAEGCERYEAYMKRNGIDGYKYQKMMISTCEHTYRYEKATHWGVSNKMQNIDGRSSVPLSYYRLIYNAYP